MAYLRDDSIILIQTDTTVGFLSKNQNLLAKRKKRVPTKKILQVLPSFQELKKNTRVPKKFRRFVRYSTKTTFIYPNLVSFRVVNRGVHQNFILKYGNFFSSSANLTSKNFQENIAENLADIICKDNRGFSENQPSKIIKLSKNRVQRIR